MRTFKRILAVAAALVVGLSLAAPVGAACAVPTLLSTSGGAAGQSFIFTSAFQNDASFYYYGGTTPVIYSATAPAALGQNPNITFWQVGAGDVALGLGVDSGTFDMIAFGDVYQPYASALYNFYSGALMFSDWSRSGIDDCIAPGTCDCVLLSSQSGNEGFWALTGALTDANNATQLNQGGTDLSGANNMPIVLVPMDSPQITGSVRRPNFDVELTVSVPAPSAGLYVKDGCACGPTGFKVLQQVVTRGSMPPSDRSAGVWTELSDLAGGAQAVTAMGGSVAVLSACGSTDVDVWLTSQLFFDSGFSTSVVSGNSTRVECGPTLADPGDRPKPLARPGSRSDRIKPRGTRR